MLYDPQAHLLDCWGKANKTDAGYHPALYHMIDVGHTALCLMQGADSPWPAVLTRALGMPSETLLGWLPFAAALHDIGKISVPFQISQPLQLGRLRSLGLPFGKWSQDAFPHSLYSAAYLGESDTLGLSRNMRTIWGQAFAGHHGTYPPADRRRKALQQLNCFEPPAWAALRQQCADQLASLYA